MRAIVTNAARAVLHVLLNAGTSVPIGVIATSAGISPRSANSTISLARKALAGTDTKIIVSGTRETLEYRIEGEDLSQAWAIAGAPIRLPHFQGFTGLRAIVLRVIVEADGRPIPLDDLVLTVYGSVRLRERQRTADVIRGLRVALAADGSPKTILSIGRQGGGVYAWGPAAPLTDEDRLPSDEAAITLPSVSGAYHYAAGRLFLDGQAVPGRASA